MMSLAAFLNNDLNSGNISLNKNNLGLNHALVCAESYVNYGNKVAIPVIILFIKN